MAVRIIEAYDEEGPFPGLFFDQAARVDGQGWRNRGVWRFELVAVTQHAELRPYFWPIRTKIGAAYEAAIAGLRRRAASRYFSQVTLYECWVPPTPETIARIERFNRQLKAARQEQKEGYHAHHHPKGAVERRASLGVV